MLGAYYEFHSPIAWWEWKYKLHGLSLKYSAQNGGHLYKDPNHTRNLNIDIYIYTHGTCILVHLRQAPHDWSRFRGPDASCQDGGISPLVQRPNTLAVLTLEAALRIEVPGKNGIEIP